MDESYPARSFSMKAEWLVAGTHNADVGSGVIHAGNIMSASASAFLGTGHPHAQPRPAGYPSQRIPSAVDWHSRGSLGPRAIVDRALTSTPGCRSSENYGNNALNRTQFTGNREAGCGCNRTDGWGNQRLSQATSDSIGAPAPSRTMKARNRDARQSALLRVSANALIRGRGFFSHQTSVVAQNRRIHARSVRPA